MFKAIHSFLRAHDFGQRQQETKVLKWAHSGFRKRKLFEENLYMYCVCTYSVSCKQNIVLLRNSLIFAFFKYLNDYYSET